ncbi:MAG: acyl-CoA dehydrogenase family protein [Candidatus Aminicenantes bacterium]|nr:acyl-CoA dehydrogenase family protein [Candidatus Aminicenantes bacterium]MDH5465822.1 acyl-CoA dehydrogenase family protein [Candidatus Aminicenantes bacterium]MDH5704583.1 acyl-CoA dehydrogenase family protein [Candidatus Aminicenantes bacterium]
MDFELTEDQRLLKEMVKDFSQKEIAPQVKHLEDNKEFPDEILAKLGEIGILGMTVPPEYGGSRTDYFSTMLALEEISKVSSAVAVIVSVHCALFCHAILEFGTEEQKKKYLPKAAKGEIIGAFSLTEPGAGSDATNLKTKAEKRGDFYLLNGTKAWVTTGNDAIAMILFTAAGADSGNKKLNAFIVEKGFPGFKISRIEEKLGLHCSPTAEIVLEDCQVPQENLLGEEGNGAAIAFNSLDGSRIGIAAQSIGLAERALKEAVQYAKQREAFGRKISEFQAIQFMIADISTLIEAARLLTYKAANLKDRGKPFSKEAAMAKLFASEAANKIVYQALQIHGGYGYSKEFFIEQLYRDARVLSIYEGTSEIQRLVISRHLLKEK